MKSLVDIFVDLAKKLPGFGLAFILVTIAYTYLKEDHSELTASERFIATVSCWILYQAASILDKLYDAVYGPGSNLCFLWKFSDLRDARDHAAAALFNPIDPRVKNFSDARQHRYVGKKPLKSLYFFCSTIAKPTDTWLRKISPKINVSKAARTVFVFALLAGLIVKIKLIRDTVGLPTYVDRLGFLSDIWVLSAIALAALVIYVVLRVLHHIELYEYVATKVMHVPMNNGKAAVIFDVTLHENTDT